MATLAPALRRHVLNPWFWWAVFKNRNNWMNCERCGYVNECLPYGESVRANYEALKVMGIPTPTDVKGPEAKKVCVFCLEEIRSAFGDRVSAEAIAEWSRRNQPKDLAG